MYNDCKIVCGCLTLIVLLMQYGLDTSEFTYNPSESHRYQQVNPQPTEERSRCAIMWSLCIAPKLQQIEFQWLFLWEMVLRLSLSENTILHSLCIIHTLLDLLHFFFMTWQQHLHSVVRNILPSEQEFIVSLLCS